MVWIFLASFVCATLASLGVLASAHRHASWSADHDLSGPQKMHVEAVPRVGGVAIFAGVLGGGVAAAWMNPAFRLPALLLLACMLPAFLTGLWEDFTEALSPRRRLIAVAAGGILGVLLLDATIVRTGWIPFDAMIAANGLMSVGAAGAVLAATGIANAVNIIDGMNGLASMCAALIMCALAVVAWRVGDLLVCGLALSTFGAALGFFVWNYPRGLVFLGDGGAYLLGFIAAELGMMLAERNPEVSMLMPLLLMAYPIFETLFTMYRRRRRGAPMTLPDGIHLHTLIYRRLMRGTVDADGTPAPTRGNSRTSPYLWLLSLVAIVPATVWWNNTPALATSLLVFMLVYLDLYWRIVTFRTPAWMSTRLDRDRERHRAALTKP